MLSSNMAPWPVLLPWQPSLLLWLFYSDLLTDTIVVGQADPQCTTSFQVWQPGQDAERMISELYLKMDNVTSYTKYQLAEIRAHVAGEVSRINNWTFAVDKRVFEMQISHANEELQQTKYTTGSSNIQREMQHTTRRVNDLEKVIYGIRSKLRNINGGGGGGNGGVKVIPSTHHHDGLQSQQGVSEDLGQSLRNKISDLRAEWILLKRDVVGLEKEDKRHRRQIQVFHNETASLKSAVDYVSSVNKDLQEKNLELTIQQSEIKERMDNVASTVQDLQMSLEDFKSQNKEATLSELKTSTRKLREDVDSLTSRLDVASMNGPAKTSHIGVDTPAPNVAVRETDAKSPFETIRLTSPNEGVAQGSRSTSRSSQPASTLQQSFKDCHDVYRAGFHVSSVYDIFPDGLKHKVPVFCYMANGTGHTLLQRRLDGTINFNRRWMEYKQGFGNPFGEVWAGNEIFHKLTKQKRYVLRVELWDWEGEQFYAEYTKFWVDGEEDQYRLHVGGYHGNAGDSLSYHDKMTFSTEDMDNDLHPRNCAAENKGGWWYNSCFYAHLNGLYHTGWYAHSQSKYADGIEWFTLKDHQFYSLKKVEMTIKPLEM